MQGTDLDRRMFVRWSAIATGSLALAGCLGNDDEDENGGEENGEEENGDEDDVMPRFPEIEDPPNAVYLPTHRESMAMLEPVSTGEYTLAPMLSYPHPFWNVTGSSGDEVSDVTPEQSGGVHIMFTLWDEQTGVVLPVDSGNEVRLYLDGDLVESQRMWSMISQQMGFHFGDNVPLDDDGTYTVEVELPPLSVRTTGDLEGRFTESEIETETATFEFEYDQAFRESVVDVEYFDEEQWGELGALEPMGHGDGDDHGHEDNGNHGDHDDQDHEDGGGDHHDHGHVPYSQLPEVGAVPGTLLVDPDGDRPEETADLPRSGDAAFLATVLESGHRLADDGQYLLVSPRTPYNRVPLPNMSLDVTVERDAETVVDTELEQTIDGEYGLHYGTALDGVQPGDSATITVVSPPQVARHQGYETAFLEMEPIELMVSEDDN